jgi:hypothetical protein
MLLLLLLLLLLWLLLLSCKFLRLVPWLWSSSFLEAASRK